MKKSHILTAILGLSLAGSLCTAAYGQKKIKVVKPAPAPAAAAPAAADTVEPDKVLYDKALAFLKRGHYTEARLDFQTLVNTYPDSEYIAKAKLGTADSFYKEGGTTNMIQAIAEYKDFITFFPFLDESAYAQMQVGMAHYRMMEKADRDNSQAGQAEQEFQTFLLKYPDSPLTPKAEQYLREVQEVLADGEFKIGRFYYLRSKQYPQDYAAATARLIEVTQRYPLYSQSDEALWMLGDVYMRAKQNSKNEDAKNHWADLAGRCYDQILEKYPLSKWAPEAKSNLIAMGMSAPKADPDAQARMAQQQLREKKERSKTAKLELPLGMFKSNPDVNLAAHSGTPNLSAPDNGVSATDVLKQGAAGPTFTVTATLPANAGETPAPEESTTPVEAVPSSAPSGGAGNSMGVEIIAAPSSEAAAAASSSSTTAAPASEPAANTSTESSSVSTSGEAVVAAPAATDANGNPVVTGAAAGASGDSASQSTQGTSSDAPQAPKADSSSESSSKKKKGLKKIIPF